ncbi:unnamed protein product [Effrenium voratum]|nr:unnamed protein product [Effrenium voratum]
MKTRWRPLFLLCAQSFAQILEDGFHQDFQGQVSSNFGGSADSYGGEARVSNFGGSADSYGGEARVSNVGGSADSYGGEARVSGNYVGNADSYNGGDVRECQGHEEQWGTCPNLPECQGCYPVDCMFSEWSSWWKGSGCVGLMFRHRSIALANNECGLPCYGTKIESRKHYVAGCERPPQNCVLSAWDEWSHCQNEKDQSVRSRRVVTPSSRDGDPCMGSLSETRPCGGPHPEPCKFGAWQSWTSCSASCGPGRYTRLRKIMSEGHMSSQTCDDALLETHTCHLRDCVTRDCRLSSWSDWSFCGAGGIQRMRHRQVLHGAQGMGLVCNASLVETSGCSEKIPHHCSLSTWSQWTGCDRSCHGGQKYRQRELLHASSHRNFCEGVKLKQAAACNTEPCFPHSHDCQLELQPCQQVPPTPIDCQWGQWADWSACSCSCGGGSKRRNRAIEMSPQNGGAPCEPKDKEVVAMCNTRKCDVHCEDGYWGAWMDWSECSATCSSGYRSRRRSLDVLPNSCGKMPTGQREEFEMCDDLASCFHETDCRLSAWAFCCNGIRERNRHIVAYSRGGGRPCDRMALKEGAQEPSECNQRPRDCVLAPWDPWSRCSTTCGVGQETRERSVAVPSAGTGRPCEGSLIVTRKCNLRPCKEEGREDCQLGPWSEWGSCSHCGGQRWRHRVIRSLPNAQGTLCEERSTKLGVSAVSTKEVSNCTSICHEIRLCAWSSWSEMQCSQQCGSSWTTLRSREMQLLPTTSSVPDYLFRGDKTTSCYGSQAEGQKGGSRVDVAKCPAVSDCEDQCLPKDCSFGAWSQWTEATCVGLCERQRVIAHMNNECGKPCSGPLLETKHCHTQCGHAVDCKLSEWSQWSHCTNLTSQVVRGQRYRHRHVVTEPERGGMACSGDLRQTRACLSEMPEDCLFSPWEAWSICSTRCGEGTQWRARRIHQVAEDGGRQCHGHIEESQACQSWHDDCDNHVKRDRRVFGGCQRKVALKGRHMEWRRCLWQPRLKSGVCLGEFEPSLHFRQVVDCVVTEWTEWDSCSRTCGSGHARRQRQISRFPSVGGELCPEDLLQIKSCVLDPCASQDCQVSDWLEWGTCSATCGGGHQSRVRTVLSLRGPGGMGCFWPRSWQGMSKGSVPWHPWIARRPQEWSECSKSCGGGYMTRTRSLDSIPSGGSDVCEERPMAEVAPCAVDHCAALCVDGAWGAWEPWSVCSSSCDGGEMFRRREIVRMANNCGWPATGLSHDTAFCNVDVACEGPKDCSFTPWSQWNTCSSTCEGVSSRHRHISEFGTGAGAFCSGALKEVTHCNPAKEQGMQEQCVSGPPVDCLLSTWAPWSSCSASCGGGERSRARHVAQEAYNGGFGRLGSKGRCQEPLQEALECARAPCGTAHEAVDCVLGEWYSWGQCDACGGERTRMRKILVYPQYGGRECPPASLKEVRECPHMCNAQTTCSWASWEAWGSCSMSCGVGGMRKRVRHMVAMSSSLEPRRYVLP